MTKSNLIAEQSTRLVGQIIEDLDRLREEFMDLNMEEILEQNPDLQILAITGLNTVKSGFYSTYIFLEGLKKVKNRDD